MIPANDLKSIALERLADAEALMQAERFDCALYLIGYCVEISLKHRICETLNWAGFPSSNHEFEKVKSVRTHDLNILLHFTGLENVIKSAYLQDWTAISDWNPESRYRTIGLVSKEDATKMVSSVKTILKML
jgi:HEPN domain-containing protein